MKTPIFKRNSVVITCSLALSACAGTANAPSACARPNVLARVAVAAVPIESPIAVQEGVAGVVSVVVTLDGGSRVTSAVVESSPSSLLNASSLRAAVQSTYETAIANCVPVASSLVVVFRYPVVPLPPPTP